MDNKLRRVKVPLNERLKNYRIDRKLTIKEVSENVGIPKTTYREWEEGRKISNHDALIKLSGLFNIPLYELLTGDKLANEKILNCIYDIEERFIELKSLILVR